MLHTALEQILPRVQKPARYVGGEWGSVTKDKNNIDLRFAFCFPDVYEVGMSHLGSRILYGLLNDQENIWWERVFAPWIDMEDEMRRAGIPLYGLESGDPLSDFDIIGFTLQYELVLYQYPQYVGSWRRTRPGKGPQGPQKPRRGWRARVPIIPSRYATL